MRMTRRSIAGGFAALLGVRGAAAQAPLQAGDADAELHALHARSGTPALGAAAIYLRSGRRVRAVVGRRRIDLPDDGVTLDDPWHLGSITKSMTATLTARCVEAGQCSWEQPLSSLLPDLADVLHPGHADTTLIQLLSHTAGLAPNPPLFEILNATPVLDDPREERTGLLRRVLARPPASRPGERMTYSNLGYIVAGAALERLDGVPVERMIEARVFAPLGIFGAGWGAPAGAAPWGHRPLPLGLGLGGRAPPAADNPAVFSPAGRAHMPLEGVLGFFAAHAARDPAFLSEASWQRLHRPVQENYALGLERRANDVVWHNGSNTMWYAEGLADPNRARAAVAVCNSGDLQRVEPAVSQALAWALSRLG